MHAYQYDKEYKNAKALWCFKQAEQLLIIMHRRAHAEVQKADKKDMQKRIAKARLLLRKLLRRRRKLRDQWVATLDAARERGMLSSRTTTQASFDSPWLADPASFAAAVLTEMKKWQGTSQYIPQQTRRRRALNSAYDKFERIAAQVVFTTRRPISRICPRLWPSLRPCRLISPLSCEYSAPSSVIAWSAVRQPVTCRATVADMFRLLRSHDRRTLAPSAARRYFLSWASS